MSDFNRYGSLSADIFTNAGGTPVNVAGFRNFAFVINSTNVTTGATVAIKAQFAPSGPWVSIDSRTINTNNATVVTATAVQLYGINVNVSARTDGNYAVNWAAAI